MQFQYESNEHSVPREPARSNIVNNVTSFFSAAQNMRNEKQKQNPPNASIT